MRIAITAYGTYGILDAKVAGVYGVPNFIIEEVTIHSTLLKLSYE
jgi:hypothetical protein